MDKQTEWETPKLIVLGRGRPEEHVLGTCKNPAFAGGPVPSFGGCKKAINGNCQGHSNS
jgi:hypothetical protein